MTNSRAKGKRGELELVRKLKAAGFDVRRGQQYCGAAGDADVVGLQGIHIEAKRNERLNLYDAMAQSVHDARPGEIPVVFWRKNNCEWLATLRLEDYLEFYRRWLDD